MSHENQVYVILGAYGGIGEATARTLTKQGAQVVLLGRNEEKLQKLSKEINAIYYLVDATDIASVAHTFETILQKTGMINGVVNCVGSILIKPAHLLSANEWQATLAVNLTTAFAVVYAASKTMTEKGGSVILISSAASLIGLPNHDAISAAKCGINGLMLGAAATYAAKHLRFNCIAPGLVETPLSEHIVNNPKALEMSLAGHPLGRIGKTSDIANAIAFLFDPENDWITGQVIAVDGGLSTLKRL